MWSSDIRSNDTDVCKNTYPMMSAGWKLWPIVSLFNFTVVPAQKRVLVGSIVGLFWGIYLSLLTSR